ncbi:MAG: citrate synthase [Nitrospirales bacterium]|nr:MAG: citrate synthase [Nitrospirales bacterium]
MRDFFPGLAGVAATKSHISSVDGQQGILEYRGIRIEELAAHGTFLETAYLLLFNELPTSSALQQFENDLRRHRRIKYRIIDLIKCLPEHGHPMDALQAAVAALGMFYPTPDVRDPEARYWSAIRLLAKLPTMVAAFARLRHGDDHIQPNDNLSYAENFFYMLFEQQPDSAVATMFDTSLILHAEHTMNASTFSGLVTASTLADPYTVISSAIGTLKGPLHGGANEAVIHMLEDIGSVEQVSVYLDQKMAAKEKIMGFGHRVYKVKDPRALILQELAQRMIKDEKHDSLLTIAHVVEREMEQRLGHKGIRPNVDFYSGIIYYQMGIATDMFTPVFAMARVAGWLAHCFEQYQQNHLFRPDQIYEGPHNRPYEPIESRGHSSSVT